jgi:ABC-type nitrate/sulfonate/bicarbonate transport system substrate-binding protein
MSKKSVLVIALILVFLVSACKPSGTGQTSKLSFSQVKFATMSNDAIDLMFVYAADELYWPKVGFTEPAKVISTDDILPALYSKEAWVAQGGTNVFYVADQEGSVDLVVIGIDKDDEIRTFGTRPGIASVADLKPGSKISGGDAGDWDELVLGIILSELGVDPKQMNIVAMGGGADARMEALLAGQLDAAIIQPRNVGPITRAGGTILYQKTVISPQEAWAVTRETLNTNRDAVCAFVLGRVQAKQWAYEGTDHMTNRDTAASFVIKHQIEPSQDELDEWIQELEHNQSLDGGATAESLDEVIVGLQQMGLLQAGFDWRAHSDFSCVHEAQASLGLPQRP